MVSDRIVSLSKQAMEDISAQFARIDEIAQVNTERVQNAFSRHRVSDSCFAATTGYGYDDKGRETLGRVFADVMNMPSALVSSGFVSGTHAITCVLFAALRHGQTLLSVTGLPYDTLHGVIGISGGYAGSLKDYGIGYKQLELKSDGSPDLVKIAGCISASKVGAVLVQRSRGYSERRALTVDEIGRICETVHGIDKNINVIVDNCYGEFVETVEPGDVGADIIAGSLIKNPGGGLVPKGGYIAGREDLVEAAANRLTAPGLGVHCGASPDGYRLMFQGLFMAPHIVGQAMKTAVFAARLFELLGYDIHPRFNDTRSDIIQMIKLGSAKALESFCRGIQAAAPVDSFLAPVGGDMPGYDCPVIMAAGTFIQGASVELSADAPMREPYNVFVQGALTFESGKHSVMRAAESLMG